ncbi:C-type lectin domain family 4 member F-like [Gadus macrocephalus]|uniref:C-type lectin domain family 4 member F-like n=1 Tax=Gadus macrocephalus TaxID=80720 RepID=UPI0028CB4B6C|nr:C-type lectin domain family 4 member F-like [Gadus macrocephalus]
MMGFELDDSLKTYNPGKESHRTVLWLKERPFRAAAVCLGVLCVVLLTGIIIVAGHHNHAAVEQPTPSCNLIGEQDQLRITCTNLTQERDLLQTSNNNLSEEMYQLQTINNNLTQERDLLQTSNKNLTEAMYQLQTINNNVTLERDQLKELQRLSEGGCLAGWQPHGGSCYFLSAENKSWMASRQDCQDRGADLVVIHSEEEQNFINNFCCAVWIGLNDRGSESNWKWVDGSPMNLR